jgi:hypothetical protein
MCSTRTVEGDIEFVPWDKWAAHLGMRLTIHRITERFYWPRMMHYVMSYLRKSSTNIAGKYVSLLVLILWARNKNERLEERKRINRLISPLVMSFPPKNYE